MNSQRTLIEQLCEYENLYQAYRFCSKGKRSSKDYQNTFFAIGEKLKRIQERLAVGSFKWSGYTEFTVHDPKQRLIMCAPFLDRVVHHAICQVIEPILDPLLLNCVYACRKGKGNRLAVQELRTAMACHESRRFAMKLDVQKYFASIDHNLLLRKLNAALSDSTIQPLLENLLASNQTLQKTGKGIPIGNLTSQLFANFYLKSADEIGVNALGDGYFRYMDDIILLSSNKSLVLDTTDAICAHIKDELLLNIPFQKRMPIGYDPIPFLGYLVAPEGMKILARTKDRFAKRIKKQIATGANSSMIAQMETSFASWASIC